MSDFSRLAARVVLTAIAAFGAALMTAVALGIFDLYLTGHSLPSLGRPWIEWPSPGSAISRADVILWVPVLVAGVLVWWVTGKAFPKQP